MDKVYTRLKINIKSNGSDSHGLGCFEKAANDGALTYQLTVSRDGKKYIIKDKFNPDGESKDYSISFNGDSLDEAKQKIRAYWEVFLDKERMWHAYAQHFFAHSAAAGSHHRDSAGGVTKWSIAHIKVTLAVSRLCTNGETNLTTVKISSCPHKHEGAMSVAEYIVQEIKKNVKSNEGNLIRSYNDEFMSFMDGHATALWVAMVAKDQKWDHKQKIRNLFASVAVERPTDTGVLSKTYYHKYKNHDYYLDVWSNIHYGYVGLSVGFSKRYLLAGASAAQIVDSHLKDFNDPIDDVTSIKLGFELYEQFGSMAQGLSSDVILEKLEAIPQSSLSKSRELHWCLDERSRK